MLTEGELAIEGRLVDASNTTLYADGDARRGLADVRLQADPRRASALGLPRRHAGRSRGRRVRGVRGDRLGRRAADRDARRTVRRRDACQLWIDIDENVDVLALLHSDHPRLRRMALFDAVVNNADRKGGHLLPTPGGHILRRRPRRLLPRRGQAAHASCGGGAAARFAGRRARHLAALRIDLAERLGVQLETAHQPPEVSATRRRRRPAAARRPSSRCPATGWPPSRGRPSERRLARAPGMQPWQCCRRRRPSPHCPGG